MKKLKLFQKTYLFTMALMGVMIIISHTLLYMLLPTFYINKKQQDLSDISTQLIQQLESNNKDMSSKIAKDFSNKYGINIALNIKNKNYVFEGIKESPNHYDYRNKVILKLKILLYSIKKILRL